MWQSPHDTQPTLGSKHPVGTSGSSARCRDSDWGIAEVPDLGLWTNNISYYVLSTCNVQAPCQKLRMEAEDLCLMANKAQA